MAEDDATYYWRRSLEEQLAAQKATCQAARERHDELATMYRFKAFMVTKHPYCWSDDLQQEVEPA